MTQAQTPDGQALRAAERAALRDRYIIGESGDGQTDYVVRLAPPGFVAVNADPYDDHYEVGDLTVVAWLDAPPPDPDAIAALMDESVAELNAGPKGDLNLYILDKPDDAEA